MARQPFFDVEKPQGGSSPFAEGKAGRRIDAACCETRGGIEIHTGCVGFSGSRKTSLGGEPETHGRREVRVSHSNVKPCLRSSARRKALKVSAPTMKVIGSISNPLKAQRQEGSKHSEHRFFGTGGDVGALRRGKILRRVCSATGTAVLIRGRTSENLFGRDEEELWPVGNDGLKSEDREKRCEPCPVELQYARAERKNNRRGGEKPRGWRLMSSAWWRLVLAKTHRVEESGSPGDIGREAHQSRTNLQERLVTVT